MQNQKIIFVTPSFQSFVKNDIRILSEEYRVIVNHYNWNNKWLAPAYMLMQLFAVLRNISGAKFIIVSFGGYWALWPTLLGKLFGKPTYIILHGTDCASIPEIGYGSLRKPLLKKVCGFSYRMASGLLPVSDSLAITENTYYIKGKTLQQGFRHFFPRLRTPHRVIPNGIDHEFWKPDPLCSREAGTFLSVFSEAQFILKGGDLILQAAEHFPNCRFYFAGLDRPASLPPWPDNVFFLGKLEPEQLKSYYNKSRFYFQLSIFEGFGCALCEAMLCGCIPIVSSVNQLPDIVGDSGYVLLGRNAVLLQEIIKKALASESTPELQNMARTQVLSRYTLAMRKKNLLSFLRS